MGICYLYKQGGTTRGCVDTVQGAVLTINDSYHRQLHRLKVFGRTEQNGTPTPDAPVPLNSVGDSGAVKVTVAGRNLANYPDFEPYEKNGITWSCKNGVVHAKGTSTAISDVDYTVDITGFIGTFTKSGNAGGISVQCSAKINGTRTWFGNTFTLDGSESDVILYLQIPANTTVDADVYPMLNEGEKALPWEPYKEIQTLPISTPNGLPGIPVDSGGNYTDEDGQQWVCDEVDFGRGKRVQRVGIAVFNGTESWNNGTTVNAPFGTRLDNIAKCSDDDIRLICNYYPAVDIPAKWIDYDYLVSRTDSNGSVVFRNINISTLYDWKNSLAENPITLMYEFATPIETDLTPEELTAYAALHTNLPNTTIYNDAGADMVVSYYTK